MPRCRLVRARLILGFPHTQQPGVLRLSITSSFTAASMEHRERYWRESREPMDTPAYRLNGPRSAKLAQLRTISCECRTLWDTAIPRPMERGLLQLRRA